MSFIFAGKPATISDAHKSKSSSEIRLSSAVNIIAMSHATIRQRSCRTSTPVVSRQIDKLTKTHDKSPRLQIDSLLNDSTEQSKTLPCRRMSIARVKLPWLTMQSTEISSVFFASPSIDLSLISHTLIDNASMFLIT